MFGHKSQPTMVYRYGARCPVEGLELVRQQMRAAHQYRNALCRQELDRREAVADTLRRLAPAVVDAEAAFRAADEAVARAVTEARQANSRERSKAPGRTADLAPLRAARRAAYAALKTAKAAAYADAAVQEALAAVDADDLERRKSLRAASGLYWGTYCTVEQGCGKFRQGPLPRFLRWTGDGKVAVQLQGGLSAAELLGCRDSRLRLEMLPQTARKPYGRVWLRVGSAGKGGREPVWAVVPVVCHRPIPDDAVVKWAYLVRRRVATHDEWSVQFVLAREGGWPKTRATSGAVGVDVGWRALDVGLRVAYWVGDDGREGQLVLPWEDVARWERVESLASTRSDNFNAARDALASWLTTAADVPEWLTETTATLGQWRSAARLAALAIRWRGERFAADEDALAVLEAWRVQDKHLYDWQEANRLKAQNWRRDVYRRFAAILGREYRTVAVEDADWRDLAKLPDVDSDETAVARVRYLQRVAAVGILREELASRAARAVMVETADTTRRCQACGHVEDVAAARSVLVRCSACGVTIDQDRRAALNLLASSRKPEEEDRKDVAPDSAARADAGAA